MAAHLGAALPQEVASGCPWDLAGDWCRSTFSEKLQNVYQTGIKLRTLPQHIVHFIIEERREEKLMFTTDATVYTFNYLHVLLRLCLVFKETGTSRLSVDFLQKSRRNHVTLNRHPSTQIKLCNQSMIVKKSGFRNMYID